MKVVFTMGGITHYLSPLLDNIVRKGVDVVMVIPSVKDNQTIGKGVKLVNSEALYQVRYSEVKQGWYGKTILTSFFYEGVPPPTYPLSPLHPDIPLH